MKCVDCGAPIRRQSTRCRVCAPRVSKPRKKAVQCPRCANVSWNRQRALCGPCEQACTPAELEAYGVRRRQAVWTSAALEVLVREYPSSGADACAALLGLSPAQVLDKANKLRLRVSTETRRRLVHDAASRHMVANNPMRRPECRDKVVAWRAAHPDESARLSAIAIAAQSKKKPSGLERKLWSLLDGFGVDYEVQAVIKRHFVVDVRIGRLVIEADGDYWHGHPRLGALTERQRKQQARDRSRDAYLRACGYTVVRIWESDMSAEAVFAALALQPQTG